MSFFMKGIKMFHTSISTGYRDMSVSRIEAERHPSLTHSRTSQSNIHIQNIHYQKSRINKFEMRVFNLQDRNASE